MSPDPEHRSQQPAQHFDPQRHVTAGRLRAQGIAVPADIPDRAWISKHAVRARTAFGIGGRMIGRLKADFLEPFTTGATPDAEYDDGARRAQGLVRVGPKGT